MADPADTNIWTALLGAAGSLAMYVVKSWWDDRREAKKQAAMERRARDIVESPAGTNDPMEAVQQAAIEQQLGRLVESARRVRESFSPPYSNGHGKIPTLDIDVSNEDKTPTEKKKP